MWPALDRTLENTDMLIGLEWHRCLAGLTATFKQILAEFEKVLDLSVSIQLKSKLISDGKETI